MFDEIDSYLNDHPHVRIAIGLSLLFFIIFMVGLLLYMVYQAYYYHKWGEFASLSILLRPFNHRPDHSHLVNLTSRV